MLRQATELLGFGLSPSTAARRYLNELKVLRHGSRLHPWKEMNFDLGNTVLARIWKIERDIVTAYRYRHDIGPAKWNGNTFHRRSKRSHDGAYCRAVADEQAKAQSVRLADILMRRATRSPLPVGFDADRLLP